MVCWLLGLEVTDKAAMSLVAFFSVVYSFYILSISILFRSHNSKELYKRIDEKNKKRGIHYLRDYVRFFGKFCVFSVALIILFVLIEVKEDSFIKMIDIKIACFSIPRDIIDPLLFGISAVNVYFMGLMLKFITNAMVEESKESDHD